MKKYPLLLLFITSVLNMRAQNAEALIKAERVFEKSCLKEGIRAGFLANVDSNGIAFTGRGPVDAKQFWTSLPAFEGVFSWSPSYAEMSISSDWGYTTGNYEHRAKTLEDTVDESGQYTTVWHKISNGEWKYLIDIGNGHPSAPLDKKSTTISIDKYSAGNMTPGDVLPGQEEQFILAFKKNIDGAYQEYMSGKYILNLTGYGPVTSADSAAWLINKIPSALKYHPAGAKISPGKDLFSVYGTFDRDDKKGNYLRIWRHEKNGWKIALEVIRI
jgi:ketosteroid isomerase-like protein